MSLTLPLEDLNHLQVSAQLSKEGYPILCLNLKSDVAGSTNLPSGISVTFQRTFSEQGFWSLSMTTSSRGSQTPNLSSPAQSHGFASPDAGSHSTGYSLNTPSESDWFSSAISEMTVPSLSSTQQNSPLLNRSSGDIAIPVQIPLTNTSASQELAELLAGATMYPQSQYPTVSSMTVPPNPNGPYPTFSINLRLTPSPDEGVEDTDFGQDSDASASVSLSDGRGRARRREYGNSTRRQKDLPCLDLSCNKRFMSEHTRRMHMAVHQKKQRKVFACTQGCSERFSRQHDRFRHEVSQHGFQSEWTCETCRGFFSSEKSLNSHKCMNSGSKRWKIGVPKSQRDNKQAPSADGELATYS